MLAFGGIAKLRGWLRNKNGLEIKIHKHCPGLLDIDGDNSANKFTEPCHMLHHLEQLFTDLQMNHQWCPDQVEMKLNLMLYLLPLIKCGNHSIAS